MTPTLEQNEAFLVNLSAPTNATLSMAQSSVVTIRNDELPQVVVKGPAGASGEPSLASFTITLKQPYYTTLNLNAATVGNTAASPGDYTAVNTTVTFPAQDVSAKTVTVTIKTDGLQGAGRGLLPAGDRRQCPGHGPGEDQGQQELTDRPPGRLRASCTGPAGSTCRARSRPR